MVLFLNSYYSLRSILPAKSIKFLFISFIGILLVSLSFTQINLPKNSGFEKRLKEANIYNQYEFLQLNTTAAKPLDNITWSIPLYIIKDEKDLSVKVYSNNNKYPIENLATYLSDSVATNYSKIEKRLLTPNLHFNADLTMAAYIEIYKEIKEGLESGNITYAVNAGGGSKQVFKDNLIDVLETATTLASRPNTIEIKQTINNEVLVNGQIIATKELKTKLTDLRSTKPKATINLVINSAGTVSNYFNIKSIIKEVNTSSLYDQLVNF